MCTLSRDDTQSPINPAAAAAPQDKWKPPPPELPAAPPSPCPPAVTVKVTQSNALCEGSALFIFHHRRPERRASWSRRRPTEGAGASTHLSKPTRPPFGNPTDDGEAFIYSASSLINITPEVKPGRVRKTMEYYFSCLPRPSAVKSMLTPRCDEASPVI